MPATQATRASEPSMNFNIVKMVYWMARMTVRNGITLYWDDKDDLDDWDDQNDWYELDG